MKIFIPRRFTPLEIPLSYTLSFSLGTTKHLKKIGAWYNKHTFGDHFPAYRPLKGSSMMEQMESHFGEINPDLQNNLLVIHSDDEEGKARNLINLWKIEETNPYAM